MGSPNRSKGRFATRSPERNVSKCPDRAVKMYLNKNVEMYPDKAASRYLDRNVLRYPSRSAEMYPDRNVRMFLNNSAIIFQDKAAQHSTFVQFVNSRPTVKSLILVFYSLFSIKQIPSSQTSI